jgi:RimJ/RimL family protein N-acetyltransferase
VYTADGVHFFKSKSGDFKMTKRNTPILHTSRLTLRKFTIDDREAMFQILRDKEVNTFLPWYPVKTAVEAEAFMKRVYLDCYEKEQAYRYAICLKNDNFPIGYVGLSNNASHDFGYGLRKEFWNAGIMTEACKAVVQALKEDGFSFITATHDVYNVASGEVMKKIGMSYRYSYVEQWQPKDIRVTFRMYQMVFTEGVDVYREYWEKYPQHFVEKGI